MRDSFFDFISSFPILQPLQEKLPSQADLPMARDFDTRVFFDNAVQVPKASFADHLQRFPRSGMAGIDIDENSAITQRQTEGLIRADKPLVHAPASGRVVLAGGEYGTVRIIDRAGYEHRLLHMHLNYEKPLNEPIFRIGNTVTKGDPLGVLGNVHPTKQIKDHTHYSIISPEGSLVDPAKVKFDDTGAVMLYNPADRFFDQLMQQRQFLYDRMPGPFDTNSSFPGGLGTGV